MSIATTSTPYLLLILVQVWLSVVLYRSSLSQNCQIVNRTSILLLAELVWIAGNVLSSALGVLGRMGGDIAVARGWFLSSIPAVLITYVVVSANLPRKVKWRAWLSLVVAYLLLVAGLSTTGTQTYWAGLFMAPLFVALSLRPWLSSLLRNRTTWVGISVVPVALVWPNVTTELQDFVVAAAGVVAGYLWWWAITQNRSGYGLLLPGVGATSDVAIDVGTQGNIRELLDRTSGLLGAPVAVASRHERFMPHDGGGAYERIASINPAALELCQKTLWVDDAIDVSRLLFNEMKMRSIAAIIPLTGWRQGYIGGWLILGMPEKLVVIDEAQLKQHYSKLNDEFQRQDAISASNYSSNFSEASGLESQINLISARIATVTAGENTRYLGDLRRYGDHLIADGVRRFTTLASQRRFAVTYLGSDRELIWALRKKIPMLRYVVSVNRVGDDNDVIICDIESVKASEQEAFIGWLMGSSPLRLVVVGRHGPERFGRGEAQSAAARHEVAFVPTRMVAEICDAVTPSTEQTAAISAKETGYGMEEEVEFLERDMAQRAVELTQGNINKAAELLGVPPRTLARRLRALNNQSGKSGDSMAEEEG